MAFDLSKKIEKLTGEHFRLKVWHKVVFTLACAVVFCTTYALILPAITLERETRESGSASTDAEAWGYVGARVKASGRNGECRVDFLDFEDCTQWRSWFATIDGAYVCSQDAERSNAIRCTIKQRDWTELRGYVPVKDRSVYELFKTGSFVMELDVVSLGTNINPKLWFRNGNEANPSKRDQELASIGQVGTYTVTIPAETILENWEKLLSGESFFFFGNNGVNIWIDCFFTDMYFVTAKGDIGRKLSGDYAYIENVQIEKQVDGTVPFDTEAEDKDEEGKDKPGNDSGPSNHIVRSFDTLSYTLKILNRVRETSPYTYYEEGKLYFEFVLPVSAEQAIFDTESMNWLRGMPEVRYQIVEGTYQDKPAQFLQGSFLCRPSEGKPYAIGENWMQLDVYLRVLAMTQGQTLQPEFTFWLEGNQVPEGIVTGSEDFCTEHGKDYATAQAAVVTVSSAPRYNVKLVDGGQKNLDYFDFSTGNDGAFHKETGRVVYGRRSNYGIILQILGKTVDHGLRGCEIPDGSPITFSLEISSVYTYNDEKGEHVINAAESGYAPLIWSFDQNGHGGATAPQDGRMLEGTASDYENGAPFNVPLQGEAWGNSCWNGGKWSAALAADGAGLNVTVSDYEIDLSKLPYTNAGETQDNYIYYTPGKAYWGVRQACFSAGEIWVVQPFCREDSDTEISAEYGSGSFTLTLCDRNLKVTGQGSTLPEDTDNRNQMDVTDDVVGVGLALQIPGSIDYDIAFRKRVWSDWNQALAEGCWDNGGDWVMAGGEMGIFDWITQKQEGSDVGVAYDQLVKFDPLLFVPDGNVPTDIWKDGLYIQVGYGAVAEGSGKGTPQGGWDHQGKTPKEAGYDEAMKEATAEDLIFFTSLSELQSKGYQCVGVLFEWRGCCNVAEFHSDREILGYATTDQNLAGNVFMITHAASVWSREDVANEAGAYTGKAVDALTNEDYRLYARNAFPSRLGINSGTRIAYTQYPAWPGNYNNQGTQGTDTARNNGYTNYKKSVYDDNGFVDGTSGTDFGDSCLLAAYTMEITKAAAQTTVKDGRTEEKQTYSMDSGQRVADFVLRSASLVGTRNIGFSTAPQAVTDVFIEDTLPKGLTYLEESSWYGGIYHQTDEGKQGVISGGTRIEPTVTRNADGTTTLLFRLENVRLDMNRKVMLPNIFYSCKIGDTVDMQNDVKDKDKLVNTAKIWSNEDKLRPFLDGNRNRTVHEINISKLALGNISKLADQVYAEVGGDMGFTMAVGNSSAESRRIVALDLLPYAGYRGSIFARGSDCKSRVTELTLIKNTPGVDFTKLQVYYTTKGSVQNDDSTAYQNVNEKELLADGWIKLTGFCETGTGLSGSIQAELPENFEPMGILVLGELNGGQTLGMHLTMHLMNDMPGDHAVNSFYESGGGSASMLRAAASTSVVSRSLEGLAWMDRNFDGIQDLGELIPEGMLDGVKVTLLKLKDGCGDPTQEANYEVYHYQGDQTKAEVVIRTGEAVSVRAADGTAAKAYTDVEGNKMLGRYKFTDLPPGIYAVRIEDGEEPVGAVGGAGTKISHLIASPLNRGSDDTRDSDGWPIYSSDHAVLRHTVILGVKMPEIREMSGVLYESQHNDSGFYERGYLLPQTGGIGTWSFRFAGGILLGGAAVCAWYWRRKKWRITNGF